MVSGDPAYHPGTAKFRCDKENAISFDDNAVTSVNNLGGQGPDSGAEPILLVKNVIPYRDQPLDLKVSVTATSGSNTYNPNTIIGKKNGNSKNGAVHNFLQINVLTGTSTNLTFEFLKSGTSQVVPTENWYLSIIDLDEGWARASRKYTVINPQCEQLVTSVNTQVRTETTERGTVLMSSMRGGKIDNPKHPLALETATQKERTATCLLKAGMDKITLLLGGANFAEQQGRNFLIGGPSSLVCASRGLCSNFACPSGYNKKVHADWETCPNDPCLLNGEGLTKCCHKEAP